ncbi:MAG: hypothetical protein ACOYXT_26715, partial [Bacteroidota bacterium]
VLLGVVSCGVEDQRLELIKEKAGLELPEDFEILRNESVDQGSIDGDFSVYIDIQFDERNFKSLKKNLEKSKENWVRNESILEFKSNDANEPTRVEINEDKRTLKFEMHHI